MLGDGGYLLELEKRGYVRAGPFTPEVRIEHPEALLEIHREFVLAGADVLQALTFYASEDKLATVGLADRVEDINRAAVAVAREAAAGSDALVAGNLSLTWAYDPARRGLAGSRAGPVRPAARGPDGLGIDLVIGETFTWLGEALIATERAKQTGLPVMTTMAFEKDPHAEEGDSAAECAKKLVDAGADIVGINCLRNPERTLSLIGRWWRCRGPGGRPARRLPNPDRPARLHLARRVPLRARPPAAPAPSLRRLHEGGTRHGGQLHRCVLRRSRRARPGGGEGRRQAAVSEREWKSPTGKPMSGYEYYGHDETDA